MTTPGNLSEQILAIPAGAGSVQTAGQTFEVRPYQGTGSYVIPIETKPGHAGITPALSLTYSTHAGSGIAGVGWSLNLGRIERRTDKGLPVFDDQVDTFTLQHDELLPVGGDDYRLRIESEFARVRHVRQAGRDFWVVADRDGNRVLYGLEPDHRLHDGGRISAWYPSQKQDANGNAITYSYARDTSSRDTRLSSVQWAGCYRVSLIYEERPDPIRSFRTGFERVQRHRLRRIAVEARTSSTAAYHTYRTYDLEYAQSALTGRSMLTAVAITGVNPDGSRHELPPLSFGYAQPDLAQRTWHSLGGALPGGSLADGNLSLVRQSGGGLPDILETTGTGHWLRDNLGHGQFGSPRRVPSPSQVLLEKRGTFISDMNGDGWGDLIVDGGARVYPGLAGGGWGVPYASAQAPAASLEAPDVRVVDLNADGLPDALCAGVGSWVFFQNLGEGRWAPGVAVLNPPPVRLDDPRVHLTDIDGDGLPDVVYMERSRVQVWPGQGRGRFGSPYELSHPPDLGPAFDPEAVIWTDLTQSGQADLLYVGNGIATVCLNQAGSGLSDPVTLTTIPQSSHGHAEPVDLLGTGTEGLLFTGHQGRPGAWCYLELFPGGTPDLLTRIDNGLGVTTSLTYNSSAAYWVADQRAGRPWRTAMPSAQIVVANLSTEDAVTCNRLGISYRYHHGVYDGAEREFRGFALVDQIDREADRGDPLPLAPVLVKRFYHTGVDVDLRDHYTALPEGTLADEVPALPWALRSLRGRLKREETFALDGNARPYMVQETAYRVFPVQQTPGASRWSFAPLPVASRTTHLERGDDRRIVETRTTYDRHGGKGYGLPVEIRQRAHGRRGAFSTPHELAQMQDLERFTLTQYVNRDEPDGDYFDAYTPSYLVGKPAEMARYGLTGSSAILLARERYFYDGEAYKGLGYPGTGTTSQVTRGRLSCKLVLAFTDDQLARAYPEDSGAWSQLDGHGRYLRDGTDHYVHAERYQYRDSGMIIGTRDPNANTSTFEYDARYGLFPVRQTDAAGQPTHLIRGELPFQVTAVLDANGNTTSFTYDPCGLPLSKSVQGKHDGSDWTGDPPTHPTEVYRYDLSATPISVHVQTRQVRLGATFDVVRYVDGFGRTVQERHTAEPDPDTGARRYRVTGWQVFNHKGLVVKAYQPVFASTDEYGKGDITTAVVETRYDPLGRVTRVDHPDGTFTATTYHPWFWTFADRNDNAGHITGTDPRYGPFVATFAHHLDTPAQTYVDALGRVIATAEDDGTAVHVTRTVLDLKDQVVEVHDARGLDRPTWAFTYDGLGRPISTHHATALGDRRALADAAGNAIWARDAQGMEVTQTFDALNRPLAEMTHAGADEKLRRQWRYVTYDESAADFAAHRARNLFGRVEEERDADGLRIFAYDHRGLVSRVSHRFWPHADSTGRPWDDPASRLWTEGAGWDPPIPAADRDSMPSYLQLPGLGDGTTLTIETTYDAAGRPTEIGYPEGMESRRTYNAAGLLERVEVDRGTGPGYQTVVDAIAYNARGQWTEVTHGNGVKTAREYDEDLARLTRIFTRRVGTPTTHFQDLDYAYDPTGNPVKITDNLSRSSFAHNRLIPNTRSFAYDARYRLTRATGKRHRTARQKAPDVLVTSPDPNDYEPYAIEYAYDAAGNFTRNQEYANGELHYKSGRIDLFNGDETEAGSFGAPAAGNFCYDANGNTTHTPRHQELAYTHDHQVRYVNLGGGGQVRDFRHGDQRAVRFVAKNGVKGLAVYLGPLEYRLREALAGCAKLVLHVSGLGRHAQAERILTGSDPDSLDLFFHHSDHLDSGHVLTTTDGDLLSQEEYFPHGGASDRRDARNRYRFIGVERDEDTGLCMTGPRTYDPVTGRFLQGDPIATDRPGTSPFAYANGAPTRRSDPSGYQDPPTPEEIEKLSTVDVSGWDEIPGGPRPPEVRVPTDPGDPAQMAAHHRELNESARAREAADATTELIVAPADATTELRVVAPASPPGSDPGSGPGSGPSSGSGPGTREVSKSPDIPPGPVEGPGGEPKASIVDDLLEETTELKISRGAQQIPTSVIPNARGLVGEGLETAGEKVVKKAVVKKAAGGGVGWIVKGGTKKICSVVIGLGFLAEVALADPNQSWGVTIARGVGAEIGVGPIDVTTVYDVGSWVYSQL